ncbi:MAG: thioredoxin domain-containing protein [Planctomycetota bacterium]|jgi:hypothetical protein
MGHLNNIQSKEGAAGLHVLSQRAAGVVFPPLALVILLFVAVDPAVCASQVTSSQHEIIPIPHPVTSLLRSKAVHRELGLSAVQIGEAEEALAQVDLPLWRLRDLPAEKRNGDAASLIGQLRTRDRAAKAGMEYPIAIDNDSKAWQAWANHIWPSTYLIDKDGYIRYWWYGELNWQGAESEKLLRSRIRELIQEPDH